MKKKGEGETDTRNTEKSSLPFLFLDTPLRNKKFKQKSKKNLKYP